MTTPVNPSFWHTFVEWMHGAEKKVEPEALRAAHELRALADAVAKQDTMLRALAAHLGPEAVAAINAVEVVAHEVEKETS